MAQKPLCIIPARGGSKRFPRKNIALLCGKPLVAYVVDAAKKSGVFDLVCVSSEDEEILKIAREAGADRALVRPEELAQDSVRVPHVCTDILKNFAKNGSPYSTFGVILPTSPLVTAEDLQAAHRIFADQNVHYVASLTSYNEPPQYALCVRDGHVKQYFGTELLKRSQDLEMLYFIDGSIIFAQTDVFLQEGDFCGSKTVPYFLPYDHSSDIDHPIDLEWAEFLLSRRERKIEKITR